MVMLQLRLDGAVPLGIGRSSVGNLSCTSKSEALGQTDAPLELLKIGYGVPRLRPDSETLPDRGRWFVRSSFRKTSTREPSCTLRWTVWRSEIAAGATGLQEMVSFGAAGLYSFPRPRHPWLRLRPSRECSRILDLRERAAPS